MWLNSLKKNCKKVFGFNLKTNFGSAASDGSVFADAGIPVIWFGTDGLNFHAENEFVVIESILNVSKVYALTAMDFLK